IQYNRNRYYDYYTGRWTTHDPLGIVPNTLKANAFDVIKQYVEGLNLYLYVMGCPVSYADFAGLSAGFSHGTHFLSGGPLFQSWKHDLWEQDVWWDDHAASFRLRFSVTCLKRPGASCYTPTLLGGSLRKSESTPQKIGWPYGYLDNIKADAQDRATSRTALWRSLPGSLAYHTLVVSWKGAASEGKKTWPTIVGWIGGGLAGGAITGGLGGCAAGQIIGILIGEGIGGDFGGTFETIGVYQCDCRGTLMWRICDDQATFGDDELYWVGDNVDY
ncbi:MAG: RHS repeat-associated core domain-containing protein, partial [Planctomycetota bacterium]